MSNPNQPELSFPILLNRATRKLRTSPCLFLLEQNPKPPSPASTVTTSSPLSSLSGSSHTSMSSSVSCTPLLQGPSLSSTVHRAPSREIALLLCVNNSSHSQNSLPSLIPLAPAHQWYRQHSLCVRLSSLEGTLLNSKFAPVTPILGGWGLGSKHNTSTV